MSISSRGAAAVLGLFLFAGLTSLGLTGGRAALAVKAHERSVVVKGLAEREVPADTVIWPLTYQVAGNDLAELTATIRKNNAAVERFLVEQGFDPAELGSGPPLIVDRHAQAWGDTGDIDYRYSATASVTLFTTNVALAKSAMGRAIELAQKGIALNGMHHGSEIRFLFTGLNDLKPGMIEEATRNARAVAERFAEDSASRLGKIRKAEQGQFSIRDRDATTPDVKNVRVVSTVEYYLSD